MHETCSTCNAQAMYRIVDATESKGNLACERCRYSFWGFSEAVRLDESEQR